MIPDRKDVRPGKVFFDVNFGPVEVADVPRDIPGGVIVGVRLTKQIGLLPAGYRFYTPHDNLRVYLKVVGD